MRTRSPAPSSMSPPAAGISFASGSQESRAMVAEVSRAWELLPRLNAVRPGDFGAMRTLLAELTGREIDDSVRVLPPFHPDGGSNLRFGRNVFVNHGCTAVVVGVPARVLREL